MSRGHNNGVVKMAEDVWTRELVRTKDDALVVPLDRVRSCFGVTLKVTSGISARLVTLNSGRVVYLRQAGFYESSGNDSTIQLHDVAGSGIGVPIQIMSGYTRNYIWDTQDNSAYGEILSGITVQTPKFSGSVHLIMNFDPKAIE